VAAVREKCEWEQVPARRYKLVSASAADPYGVIHKVSVLIRAVLDASFFIRRLFTFICRILSLSASFFIRKVLPSSAVFLSSSVGSFRQASSSARSDPHPQVTYLYPQGLPHPQAFYLQL
jgi:hypothetical protein